MKKQLALALTAGVAATGAVVASAATLGGVSAKDLGADTAVVASCQQTPNSIKVDYTTDLDQSSGNYVVTHLKLTGIDATCKGESYSITLSKGSAGAYQTLGAALTGFVPADITPASTLDVSLSPGNILASDLTHVGLLITSSRPS